MIGVVDAGAAVRARRTTVIVALAVVAACGSEPAESPPAERPILSAASIANFPPHEASLPIDGTTAITSEVAGPLGANPAVVFESFQNDLAACAKLVEVMRSDPTFATQIEQALSGKAQGIDGVLRRSRYADSKEIRHLLENITQFRINQSIAGEPYAAAALMERSIYCAPSQSRLVAIERLGPSADAWKVREYFLTGALRDLRMPWEEPRAASGGFERLRDEVESAARLYGASERAALESWLAGAISHLAREQILAESIQPGANGATRDQGVLSAWIATLEGIRSIRTTTRAGLTDAPVNEDDNSIGSSQR